MPQMINTNIASLNAQRNLDRTQSANQQAMERLSSGLRINSAKDDAAGLAISTRFTSQINGLGVAVRNAGDGIALAQTAEGALSSVNDNLQRIRELAVQSANATNSDVDREALQAEVEQLVSEISRTAEETDFNGRKLLDGSFSATFQIGANAGQTVDVSIDELTSDRLGASSQSGLSARGTDSALENGDLIINGVAIAASKAEDDSASTNNNSASAISKAAAINRYTEETGVTAYVNENVAAGSEMAGASGGGTFSLNGVDIDFSTTTDTASTRAAITQAINAAADQTGVMAVDTNSAATGINLVAEDGRNIQLSYDTANLTTLDETTFASATGLAGGATNTTGTTYSNTYEGGYTLVADGDQSEIEITGGNGTGRGDLNNAGLSAGSYDRATAVSVSDVVADTTTASTIGGGSLSHAVVRADSGATFVAKEEGTGTNYAGLHLAHTDLLADTTTIVKVGETSFSITDGFAIPFSRYHNQNLDNTALAAGLGEKVNFFEQIDINIDNITTAAGASVFTIGGIDINLLDSGSPDYQLSDQLVHIQNQINSSDFSGAVGATGFVVAEVNQELDELAVRIKNESTTPIVITVDASTSLSTNLDGTGGSLTLTNHSYVIAGHLAYESLEQEKVEVTLLADGAVSNQLLGGETAYSTQSVDHDPLVTQSPIGYDIEMGTPFREVGSGVLRPGLSVSEIATELSSNESVNAWEEMTLILSEHNLIPGDVLKIAGIDVPLQGDGSGSVSIRAIVDSLNAADFSASKVVVSAQADSHGTGAKIQIRNFNTEQVQMESVNSDGRGIRFSSPDVFVGEQPQTLSGEIQFASPSGEAVAINMTDPDNRSELFAGPQVSSVYTGTEVMEAGTLVINGVSIGAAVASADSASAVLSSDGAPILSSGKQRSAISLSAAINQSSKATGVSASVNPTLVVGGDGSAVEESLPEFEVGDQAGIYINGVAVGTLTLQDDGTGIPDTQRARMDAVQRINRVAGQTGVTAVDNGVSLTLSAEDGRNISIAIDDKSGSEASIGALFGLDSAQNGIGEATFGVGFQGQSVTMESTTYETTYGTFRLFSAQPFSLEGGAVNTGALSHLGLAAGTYGGEGQGLYLSQIDISTHQGAQEAITAVDNALQVVAEQRADLGAVQNRLDSTVQNLEINSENLSSAKSQIVDADFAVATADMSRSQVLQQAGISVLAQANASSQQVLTLLEAG